MSIEIQNITEFQTLQDLFEVLQAYSERERKIIYTDGNITSINIYERTLSDSSVVRDFTFDQ